MSAAVFDMTAVKAQGRESDLVLLRIARILL